MRTVQQCLETSIRNVPSLAKNRGSTIPGRPFMPRRPLCVMQGPLKSARRLSLTGQKQSFTKFTATGHSTAPALRSGNSLILCDIVSFIIEVETVGVHFAEYRRLRRAINRIQKARR